MAVYVTSPSSAPATPTGSSRPSFAPPSAARPAALLRQRQRRRPQPASDASTDASAAAAGSAAASASLAAAVASSANSDSSSSRSSSSADSSRPRPRPPRARSSKSSGGGRPAVDHPGEGRRGPWFSDWCGWHNDHGSLTSLVPAMPRPGRQRRLPRRGALRADHTGSS